MGWYGEKRDDFQEAAAAIDDYPRNSLGWLLAARKWNATVYEVSDQWKDGFDGEVKLPTNCDRAPDDGYEPFEIDIPDFDSYQILTLSTKMEVRESSQAGVEHKGWDGDCG